MCPPIERDKDAKVKYINDGFTVRSHVTYSCVDGHEMLTGNATCECHDNGWWSCGPPPCTSEYNVTSGLYIYVYVDGITLR